MRTSTAPPATLTAPCNAMGRKAPKPHGAALPLPEEVYRLVLLLLSEVPAVTTVSPLVCEEFLGDRTYPLRSAG